MNTKHKILAIDDDASFLSDLKQALENDFDVKTVTEISDAMRNLIQGRPELVLLDMRMPDVSGMDFLKVLNQRSPELPVIMLTGESKPELIVEAMKKGATDYVVKGSDDFLQSLRLRISQALTLNGIKKQNEMLSSKIRQESVKYEILGISPATIRLRSEMAKFKGTNAYVLILGENGTGKELVARNLNIQENNPARPFVAINCGAIPQNLFESELFGHIKGSFTGAIADQTGKFVAANGGDIFLDEIGELPQDMQVKLLRVLQEKTVTPVGSNKSLRVDVRVIAATNKKLEDLVRQGKFREDLFFRLNQITLKTTALRERREDILFLAKIFAKRSLPGVSISKETEKALEKHSWSGNIRELENAIERACLLVRGTASLQILPEHLMLAEIRSGTDGAILPYGLLPQELEDVTDSRHQECLNWIEKVFFEKALEILDGDNGALFEKLKMSKSFYYRRKRALAIGSEDDWKRA